MKELSQLHQLFLESTGICTDTRKLKKGNLYLALKGDNFNGNNFATKALELGANYSIIDEEPEEQNDHIIKVEDGLDTLQKLAAYHRKYLNLPILSITGSNGKTTTKELIREVLSKKYKTVSTKGNLNNHIGVPLTLLSMNKETEFGIVEMGANHQGEIASLCKIAQPDYGYITNFGKAHLEGFGGVEGVIKGKSELYNYLIKNNKTIFINYDDEIQVEKSEGTDIISFSEGKNATHQITFLKADPFVKINTEDTQINSQLIGTYNAKNIAAAICIGKYFKIPVKAIKEAIERKLKQEQESLEYEFRLVTAAKEAEKQRIEARGKADANRILAASLTPNILRDKGIEATLKLAESSNSKVVVVGSGDDGLPLILGNN